MEGKIDKDFAKGVADTSSNPIIQDMAKKIAEREQLKEAGQDEVTLALLELSKTIDNARRGEVDVDEVENIVNDKLKDYKITVNNLSASVRSSLGGGASASSSIPVSLTITTPTGTKTIQKEIPLEVTYPLYQLLISDVLARNNSYLYGGAGTGKTFSAQLIADLLGWELITLECNQFTSKLDILGGQTIDGYQKGKVEIAWSNISEDGKKYDGCVLLLDELPKIDPNTAGVLNGALAKVKDIKALKDDNGKVVGYKLPTIENGRNQKIEMKNIFIMATGNSKLNEADKDYEANFKQDLSLQDRFSGSTYEVFVNIEVEWKLVMQEQLAFVFLYLNKLRQAIINNEFTSQAFVSVRLMQNMRDTYYVFRGDSKIYSLPDTLEDEDGNSKKIFSSPKTIKQTLDSFLSLFSEEQRDVLKDETNYSAFIILANEKNSYALDKINTPKELEEVQELLDLSNEKIRKQNEEVN
mgnify:FL=1|tara:strand:- start:1048 stop:2454 length:1407 start_codon:yes stop_codon:yes gene_type:complete